MRRDDPQTVLFIKGFYPLPDPSACRYRSPRSHREFSSLMKKNPNHNLKNMREGKALIGIDEIAITEDALARRAAKIDHNLRIKNAA